MKKKAIIAGVLCCFTAFSVHAASPDHLLPRTQSQHTLFMEVGRPTIISLEDISCGDFDPVQRGLSVMAGYNWTSKRGFGVGFRYWGDFVNRQNSYQEAYEVHYIAPEFVARQRVGRRILFRESVGMGFGFHRYGDDRESESASHCGFGFHETVRIEVMLTRNIGLNAHLGGQCMWFPNDDFGMMWDVENMENQDDDKVLDFDAIIQYQIGAGLCLYF